jgi:Penicillin-Binding Protein C-terminus Family
MFKRRAMFIVFASVIIMTALGLLTRGAMVARAGGGQTVITFDDIDASKAGYGGVRLLTQYQPRGVVFGSSPGMPGPTVSVIQVGAGAHSGKNVARLPEACGVEAYRNEAWAQFVVPTSSVSVYAENAQPGSVQITMDGYSTSGKVIASASASLSQQWEAVSLNDANADIAFVHIYGPVSQGCIYLDDFTFSAPATGAKPDFGLFFGGTNVGAAPGSSGSGIIGISRFAGSNGRIQFSISGLPPNVSASFSPQPATGSSLQSDVTLTITAQQGAPPNIDEPVTVTGKALDSSAGDPNAPRSVVIPLTIAGTYKLVAQGIEVTQGVQPLGLPVRSFTQPVNGTFAQPLLYTGVALSAGHKTIARVFVEAVDTQGSTTPNVELWGYSGGQALPGPNPILSDNTGVAPGLASVNDYSISYGQRVDQIGTPYEFTLPDAWTHGALELAADAVPQTQQSFDAPTDAACSTQTCLQLEDVALSGIIFRQSQEIEIATVTANLSGYQPGPPEFAFSSALNLLPLDITVDPYMGDIEMIDIFNDGKSNTEQANEALNRIEDYDDNNSHFGGYMVGISPGVPATTDLGMTTGSRGNINQYQAKPVSIVTQTRYLTSVAHEFGHALGRAHASSDCGANPSRGTAESWPVDQPADNGNSGDMDSIGIDVSSQAPHTIEANLNGDGSKPVWHDFMGYCAGVFNNGIDDYDAPQIWISAKGWGEIAGAYLAEAPVPPSGEVLALLDPLQISDASTIGLAGAPALTVVRGYFDGGKATITQVGPAAAGMRASVGAGTSEFHVRFRGGLGQVVSDQPMQVELRHLDPSPRGGGSLLAFSAVVPTVAANELEIVRSGQTIARRVRPAHPPVIAILGPRAGETLGMLAATSVQKNPTSLVRWTSRSEGRSSFASVEVSTDGGDTWRTVYAGPDKGRALVPSSLFSDSATGAARVRVRVNDGFNESQAVSEGVTTLGSAPIVRIVEPRDGRRFRGDALIYLRGVAFDNARRHIATDALTWSLDGRVVAHGERASLFIPRPGVHALRLQARDARGRVTETAVKITASNVKPLFLQLRPPASIRTTDEIVRLEAATTIPATLVYGSGRSVTLDRTPKVVVVPIQPGHGPALIRLRLEAGEMNSEATLVIPRHSAPQAMPVPRVHCHGTLCI